MQRSLGGRLVGCLAVILIAATGSALPEGPAGSGIPVVAALVLDTSGSVAAPGLERARALSLAFLKSLPAGSEVAVFTFDDESRLVLPRTSRPDEVQRAVTAVRIAGRRTALYDALYDASRYLAEVPGSRKAIVLITDGKDEDSALNAEDALGIATKTGIPVYPVGVGTVQERVLRRIAKLTGGDYLGPQAAGPLLASKIAALPVWEARPSAAASPPAAATTVAPTRLPAGDRTSPVQSAKPAARSRLSWVTLGLAALITIAGVALVVLRRRNRTRCPRCGRPLSGPAAVCESCPPRDRVVDADLSPTVMARLNATEEYLDKTITLRERPVLAVTRGPATGQIYELSLESATSLGRAKANDVVLPDVAVSSEHCRVRPEDGRFVLHDLKSTNGTFVNDRRVARHPLIEGDVIKVGETSLQFRKEHRRS